MSCRLTLRAMLVFCAAMLSLPAFSQSVTVSPTSLSFGNQVQGMGTAVKKVTLKNGQTSAITITSISSSLTDYTQTNTCPASPSTLAAGRSCTISVTFTPTALGTRTGTLTVTDTGGSSPQTVSLSGTGIAAVTVSKSSISFGNEVIGVKSGASKVTVMNNQATALTINSIKTALPDYTTTTTCPISPTTLAGHKSCSISVFFDPTIAGSRNDTLTVNDNANVSPTVSLSGTGIVAVSVNPSSLNFGNQALGTSSVVQTATLTNNQATALTITSISSNLADFTYTTTCPLSPSTLPAGASCTVSITFAPTALGTRSGTLTFTDNANNTPQTISLTGTGTAANLVSIALSPANASLAKGTTQQITATGTYSDGSTQNLTSSVTWSSSASNVVSIASTGLATAASIGSASITATSGSISGSTTVNVTAATLVSIAVTPAIPSIGPGTTLQFTATGTYTDASTQNITSTVQWVSSDPAVATISNSAGTVGLATGVAQGNTTISASSGSVTGSTLLTVTTATLVSIAFTPAVPSIALGTMQQFTATGTYSDGSTQVITNTVQWSSDTLTVATIGSATGLATSVGQGTAEITATMGSVTGSTTLTVTPAILVSIAVNPLSASIPLGTTQQFTATGTFSDGTTQDITQSGSWSSSVAAVATVSNAQGTHGLATSVGTGATTITVSSASVTGSATLSVNAASLVSITVNPQNPDIALGTTQQFTATGTYTDGSTQDITSVVTWSTTNSAVAVISNTLGSYGLATSAGQGTATITATSSSISGSTSLTVSGPSLASIGISPVNPTLVLGSSLQFAATGTYTDGSTQDVTSTAVWSSSNTGVATIGSSAGSFGFANSVGLGGSTITATSGAISGSTTLTVVATGPSLVSISVTPLSASIALGTKQQFTATGNYSDGSSQNLTGVATWTSSATNIASVSNIAGSQGLASSVSLGTVSISATYTGVSGSGSLTVGAATLTTISITPQAPMISAGTTQQFTATGTYTDASTQNITTSAAWSSATLAVASISNSAGTQGLATGLEAGTSTITASDGSISGTTVLTVDAATGPPSWTLRGPSGRRSHSAVFDPVSQQMIIFGGLQTATNAGLNDVWLGVITSTLTESFVVESPTGPAPQGRYGHVATYDSTNNRMMVFGGNVGSSTCANDLWILTGANGQSGTPAWISATVSGTAPSARANAGGAYDPNTNSMIVFGGNNCGTNYFNDVWVLSNANGVSGTSTWTQLAPAGTAPPARQNGTAVYDSTNNILIVYAGDAGGTPFGDVWVLSNANGTGGTPAWTQLLPTGTAPPSRTGQSATFDGVNDRMTIFGGTSGSSTMADVWVLTNANGIGATPTWVQSLPTGTAPSVAYHSAVYDSAKNNLYVFAGISSQDKLQANNHAFLLNSANGIVTGTQKWTLAGPAARYSHAAFYDSVTNSMFLFGGQHATTNANFNDYWQQSSVIGSNNVQWTSVTTKGTKPSARFGHTGVYDSGSNRLLVFGGATGFPAPCMNDYWVLQQANGQGGSITWVAVTPTGTAPGIRTRHASAYDPNTNTLMIFGGYDCQSTYYNDVWILQNANDMTATPNWVKLQPAGGPPSARESSSAVYDPTTNSLIVFGGDAGSTPVKDLWILSNANGSGGTPNWTQVNPSNSGPSARSGHSATYDSKNNVMTLYGGFDGTNVLNDTWTLTGANGQGSTVWTQLASGQPRRFHSSLFDSVSDEMITFGGTSGLSPQAPSADTYMLSDENDVP